MQINAKARLLALDRSDQKPAKDLKDAAGKAKKANDQLLKSDDDAVQEVADEIDGPIKTVDKKSKVMEQL